MWMWGVGNTPEWLRISWEEKHKELLLCKYNGRKMFNISWSNLCVSLEYKISCLLAVWSEHWIEMKIKSSEILLGCGERALSATAYGSWMKNAAFLGCMLKCFSKASTSGPEKETSWNTNVSKFAVPIMATWGWLKKGVNPHRLTCYRFFWMLKP